MYKKKTKFSNTVVEKIDMKTLKCEQLGKVLFTKEVIFFLIEDVIAAELSHAFSLACFSPSSLKPLF